MTVSQLVSSFMLGSEHLDNESSFPSDLGEKMKHGQSESISTFYFSLYTNPSQWVLLSFFFSFINCLFTVNWVFVAAHRLSLIAEWGLLFLPRAGSSLRWLLLLWNTGSRHMGFGSCGLHSCGSQALEVWASVVILRHVRSSCTKDWPCVPSLGGQIRNHWTTREVPYFLF